MSDKFHFNPETGKVGRCSATVRDCAFAVGDNVPVHYSTEDGAREAYEETQAHKTFTVLSKDKSDSSDMFGFIDGEQKTEVVESPVVDESALVKVNENVNKYISDIDEKKKQAIVEKSKEFVENLTTAELEKKDVLVDSISAIGDQAFRNSAMLAMSQIEEGKLGNQLAGASNVGKDLVSLRNVLEEIQPTDNDFMPRKILGVIPFGSNVVKWTKRFESNEQNLQSILKSLDTGRTELDVQNNKLKLQMDGIKNDMAILRDSQVLLNQLDVDLQKQISDLKSAGNVDKAKELETTALFKVRQRRADVAQQIVVSLQAYGVNQIIVNNNALLQDNIERTKSTTVSALVTSIQTQQALGYQRKVVDGINSMNELTNDLILKNSQTLSENSSMINEQAMTSAIDPKVLEESFKNIFRTLDESDIARQRANDRLLEVTNALENVVENARSYSQMKPAIDEGSRNLLED